MRGASRCGRCGLTSLGPEGGAASGWDSSAAGRKGTKRAAWTGADSNDAWSVGPGASSSLDDDRRVKIQNRQVGECSLSEMEFTPRDRLGLDALGPVEANPAAWEEAAQVRALARATTSGRKVACTVLSPRDYCVGCIER